MPSIPKLPVEYVSTLDEMVDVARAYLQQKDISSVNRRRAEQGIRDFCLNYGQDFKKKILSKVGISATRHFREYITEYEKKQFINELVKIEGECVFLLRDAFEFMESYIAVTKGDGFGILANRPFICGGDEGDYLKLTELIYTSLKTTDNYDGFLSEYHRTFQVLIESNPSFYAAAKAISEYIVPRMSGSKIVLVDIGFQYTFSMFCKSSVKYFNGDQIESELYNFSTYPWLQSRFQGKFYTEKSGSVVPLEIGGAKTFRRSVLDRSEGSLLGFAIGDALGFPAAGVEADDISRVIGHERQLSGFETAPNHPFFSTQKAGQYTSNTILMKLTSEHLVNSGEFNPQSFASNLIAWAQDKLGSPVSTRWLGPTTSEAISNLIGGATPLEAGSTTTDSCAAAYRSVPIGLFFRPMSRRSWPLSSGVAASAAAVTHNSKVSVAGAVVVAAIIGDLCHGIAPEKAVRASISLLADEATASLRAKLWEAIKLSRLIDEGDARHHFGTGSPIEQTLPLAVFLFLKHADDFRAAVLAGATSYRQDSDGDRVRLGRLSFEAALIEAKGGNTDGIAALTGAFVGAHLGQKAIPVEFRVVEDGDEFRLIGSRLV